MNRVSYWDFMLMIYLQRNKQGMKGTMARRQDEKSGTHELISNNLLVTN